MLNFIEIEHQQCVLARGFEERVVPLQFRKMIRNAFVVEQFEEFALRFVARRNLRLCAGRKRKEKRESRGKTQDQIFQARKWTRDR